MTESPARTRRHLTACALLLLFFFATITTIAPPASADHQPLLADLAEHADVSGREIRRLGDDVLVKELPVPDSSTQAAYFGIVRISSDGSRFAERFERVDPTTVLEAALSFGRFGEPPSDKDVAGLRFPEDDYEVLSECKIKVCRFKLSARQIQSLPKVDWGSSAGQQAFTSWFQDETLQYVEAYRGKGNASLILYADKSKPAAVADSLLSIVDQLAIFRHQAPRFTTYLNSYPEGKVDSVSDSITWTVQDFGYRPTLSIDHHMIDRKPEIAGGVAALASKTIYANHYLAGRLQVGAVVDGNAAFGVPGHYIIFVDRINFDDSLGRFKRSMLGRGLNSDMENRMKSLRVIADGR